METTFRRRTLRDDPFLRCETLQLVPHFRSPLFSTCHLLTILKSCALKSDPTRENKRKNNPFLSGQLFCPYFSFPARILFSTSPHHICTFQSLAGFLNQTPLQISKFRSLNISKNFGSVSFTSTSSRLLKMISIPTLVTLFSTVATLTLAHSSPSRLNTRSLQETHTSLVERGSTCPPPIMAQYFPAWTAQSPSQLDWKRADVAYYFGEFSLFCSDPFFLDHTFALFLSSHREG